MVALPRFEGLSPRIVAASGATAMLIVALIVVAMPTGALESIVSTSGVAALVPAAQPPLGLTARAVLALIAGGLAGALAWSVLYLLVGPEGFLVGDAKPPVRRTDAPPVVRRADAHPDAPPRRPISAADLGDPIEAMPRVERPLPQNLEQPLSAFDPAAIPAAPRAPIRPVAPLPRPQPDARIETIALPPVKPEPVAPALPKREPVAAPPSIETLLRRLEQGAQSRAAAR